MPAWLLCFLLRSLFALFWSLFAGTAVHGDPEVALDGGQAPVDRDEQPAEPGRDLLVVGEAEVTLDAGQAPVDRREQVAERGDRRRREVALPGETPLGMPPVRGPQLVLGSPGGRPVRARPPGAARSPSGHGGRGPRRRA